MSILVYVYIYRNFFYFKWFGNIENNVLLSEVFGKMKKDFYRWIYFVVFIFITFGGINIIFFFE